MVRGGPHEQQLCDSLDDKAAQHDGLVGLIPTSQWTDENVRSLGHLKDTYAWSWLVCHLLEYNPNYRTRFRTLGQDYLANREDTFGKLFDPMAKQLAFEYQFTVDHMAPGYRVDLCAWDWDKRFRNLDGCRPIRTKIVAARGYQASGLLVAAGQSYAYSARGTWTDRCTVRPGHGRRERTGNRSPGSRRHAGLPIERADSPGPRTASSRPPAMDNSTCAAGTCGTSWTTTQGSVVVTFSRTQ